MSNLLFWPCHQIKFPSRFKTKWLERNDLIYICMWYAKWNKTLKHNKCGKQSKIAKQEIQHLALILIPATSAVPQLMENGKQGKLRKGFHQILSHLHTDELWRTLPNAGVNPSSISPFVELKEKANFWGKSIFGVGKTNYGLADSSLGGEGNPFNKTVKTSSKTEKYFSRKIDTLAKENKLQPLDPLRKYFLSTNK